MVDKPRFELAKVKGRDFFNRHINSTYIDYIDFVKKMGWDLVVCDLKGEEGYTFYNKANGLYQINIDNSGGPKRNKFTLIHEISHIVMGHYIDFDVNSLTKKEYKILDIEADVVAGEILMPYKYIKLWNADFETMKFRFDVNKSALETRLKFLRYEINIEGVGL